MKAGEGERPEDALERLLAARRVRPRVLEDAGELAPLAEMAGQMERLGRAIPAAAGEDAALRRLLREAADGRARPAPAGLRALASGWLSRPVVRAAAAAVAAIAVVGGAGLGAAAATGSGQPVRAFLRISSNSTIKVEFTGVVLAVEGDTLRVDTGADVRMVVVGPGTSIEAGDRPLTAAAIAAGQTVEVRGRLRPDNRIEAIRVRIEVPPPAPESGTPAVPPSTAMPGTPAAKPSAESPGGVPDEPGDDRGGDAPDPGSDDGIDDANDGGDHPEDNQAGGGDQQASPTPGQDHGEDDGDPRGDPGGDGADPGGDSGDEQEAGKNEEGGSEPEDGGEPDGSGPGRGDGGSANP
jgi:hypothetical protein